MTSELPDDQRERNAMRQRELSRADPVEHLMRAEHYTPGHPMRDSHERVAMVAALMLLTHRVGELAKVIHRTSKDRDE